MAIDNFLKQFNPILYRRKERIIIPGDETNNIYYLAQGFVTQNIISPNGNQFTPYIFAPEEFFPLIICEENNIDSCEYESLTPVEVYRIPKERFKEYLIKDPSAAFILNKQLSKYSSKLLKKLETKVFDDAIHIVISRLLDLAELFGQKEAGQIVINYWFTHQDIANISGLSREVVTIQMNNLIRKKMITYKNHYIAINDKKALEKEIQTIK